MHKHSKSRSQNRGCRRLSYLELSELVLELATHKAIEGQNLIKGLVKTKYVPAIAECADNYKSVADAYRRDLSLLKHDQRLANYNVATASDGSNSCEKVLAAVHISISFTKPTRTTKKISIVLQ